MKKISNIILLISVAVFGLAACNRNTDVGDETGNLNELTEIAYDSVLAQKYGADDYGMRKYVMAFLKRGPNRELDAERATELQMAHLENITRMAKEGKLVLAGPFFGDGDIRGIYIFNVQSIEEAEALTKTDPAIIAGSLEMELIEWYGSAALVALNDLHKKIEKKGITE